MCWVSGARAVFRLRVINTSRWSSHPCITIVSLAGFATLEAAPSWGSSWDYLGARVKGLPTGEDVRRGVSGKALNFLVVGREILQIGFQVLRDTKGGVRRHICSS